MVFRGRGGGGYGSGSEGGVDVYKRQDKKVAIAGSSYTWEVSRATVSKIDKEAMKADGVLDKYTSTEYGYKLMPKVIKEG